MTHIFEELDFQETPLGDISLRKRSEPHLDNKIIYEIKMNEESSNTVYLARVAEMKDL